MTSRRSERGLDGFAFFLADVQTGWGPRWPRSAWGSSVTRAGRNARYLSLGNAIAAAAMGVAGYLYANRAIFVLTAALGVPA